MCVYVRRAQNKLVWNGSSHHVTRPYKNIDDNIVDQGFQFCTCQTMNAKRVPIELNGFICPFNEWWVLDMVWDVPHIVCGSVTKCSVLFHSCMQFCVSIENMACRLVGPICITFIFKDTILNSNMAAVFSSFVPWSLYHTIFCASYPKKQDLKKKIPKSSKTRHVINCISWGGNITSVVTAAVAAGGVYVDSGLTYGLFCRMILF